MVMKTLPVVLAALFMMSGCAGPDRPGTLQATYLGNEGFLISMGATKVFIDALSRSEYYASPSDSTVAMMMDGRPPFDNITAFLVTHDHPDHFNTQLVSEYLRRHPSVRFIADSATTAQLTGDELRSRVGAGVRPGKGAMEVIREDGLEVTALCLDHGGSRSTSSLAFIVKANGRTIMHLGDAMLGFSEEYLEKVDWSSYTVDVMFIQYFEQSSVAHDLIRDHIKPKQVVLMHVPPGEEEAVMQRPEKLFGQTWVFTQQGESKRFDREDD
jgi:L-ascorbate metabolism protein UlaG (beta-lactamase superfamily)